MEVIDDCLVVFFGCILPITYRPLHHRTTDDLEGEHLGEEYECRHVTEDMIHSACSSWDKTFVLFWGAYHVVSTVPYPLQGSQVTITPEKL